MRVGASNTSSGTVLYRRKGITEDQYKIEREELLERANAASRAKKKILHGDLRPLRVVLARCKTLVKALTLRTKLEFPTAVKPSGWFPDRPISDSSDPIKDPMAGEFHEICTLFADGQYKRFNDLLNQRETGKTAVKQRAERKKAIAERQALATERTKDLMELRKRKKEQAMEGV